MSSHIPRRPCVFVFYSVNDRQTARPSCHIPATNDKRHSPPRSLFARGVPCWPRTIGALFDCIILPTTKRLFGSGRPNSYMLDENVIPMPLFIVQDGQRKRVVWCWRPYIHYYAAGHQCRSDEGANETAQRYVMLCYNMICYSAPNACKFHFN